MSWDPCDPDKVTVTLHPAACVFARRTRTTNGKRVKLRRPEYFAGRVYTLWEVEECHDQFIGITYHALTHRGGMTRVYAPVCTFTGDRAMQRAELAADLLNTIAELLVDDPLKPTLIGWDGQHRGHHVTIDGVDIEMHGWTQGVDDTPRATHNLAWAWLSGLDTRHGHELTPRRAVIDLESLHQDRRFPDDWWIDTVHHVDGNTYSEGPQLLTQVVRIESPDARRFVANKTGDSKWLMR